jgi:hypothetical protein
MTTEHPITPPPELVDKWVNQSPHINPEGYIATSAAQWGADQELEACIKWIQGRDWTWTSAQLRAARRPQPPSLKEEALAKTKALLDDPSRALLVEVRETLELNRRALEALPND